MIDTKALREKILDLAMRGKLVPQDPTDEPASELLKRIKEEKEQLIKEKKIRRDKNETEIFQGDDGLYYEKFQDGTVKEVDVPYELPEGWAWSRLSHISDSIQYGYTASAKKHGDVKLLRITDIQNNFVDWTNVPYCDIEESNLQNLKLVNGDIVIARTGGTIGKSFLIENLSEASVFASYLIRIQLNQIDSSKFIKLFVESPLYWSQLKKLSSGTGQPNVNATNLKTLLLPIPPKLEQQKIILEIEQYFKLVQSIEIEQESLNQLSDQLKKKVLETAMQGKLVPQDPSDEPASVLLEKIRAEKQRLYEEGKLKKKDLQESIIYKGDDNSYYQYVNKTPMKTDVPFEISSYWNWSKLGDITSIVRGGSPRPIKNYITDSTDGINWIKIGDTEQGGKYITQTKEKIIKEGLFKTRMVRSGDFLLSNSMSFGRPYITKIDGAIHDGWLAISDFEQIFTTEFLYYYLSSSTAFSQFIQKASGTAVKNLNRDKVASIWIPIVPLNQQNRIVNKLDEVFERADNLVRKR